MRNEKRNVSDPFGTGNDTVAFGPGLNTANLTVGQHIDADGRWLDLAFAGGKCGLGITINEYSRRLLVGREHRRWLYGEWYVRAANNATWRKSA